MRDDTYPDPVSDPEAEGLPGTADDDSTAWDDVESGRESDGPSPGSLPTDRPLAVDHFGVTFEEQRIGESLDYKLARERGEPDAADGEPLPSQGDDVDTANEELDRPSPDAGLATVVIVPDDSPVSLYDRPDVVPGAGEPVGRLVEPDEGAHSDEESTAVAWDAGAAGGGASAEEAAMHDVTEG